ncbi:MAG: hypothetical protein ACKKL5_00960 [Candidatus Komeilibacteria bacterium]
MKTKWMILISVMLFWSCGNFWSDYLTNEQAVTISLARQADSAYFESNMFLLDSADAFTQDQRVWLTDSLSILTMVSESNSYWGRVVMNGRIQFSDFTLAGTSPTNWIINPNTGIAFWFDIDPGGNLMQSYDNLADTLSARLILYAPAGNSYHINGTATNYEDLVFVWQPDSGFYQISFTTLPGIQRYDLWGGNVLPDSVVWDNAVIDDISGDYIRFDVHSNGVTILDSTGTQRPVYVTSARPADSVVVMVESIYGHHLYRLSTNDSLHWSRQIQLPTDSSLIYLRSELDGFGFFANVYLADTPLHHLETKTDSNKYYFTFRLQGDQLLQEANNIILTIQP